MVKDLENVNIKAIFSSQTYVYVVTEEGEVKGWGEWFYDRANVLQEEHQ